jgi:hypothetical protein
VRRLQRADADNYGIKNHAFRYFVSGRSFAADRYARSSYHAVDRQNFFLRASEMVGRTHVTDG